MVERFRRVQNGSLQYDVTVKDRMSSLVPGFCHVDEFVCETSKDYNKLFDKK